MADCIMAHAGFKRVGRYLDSPDLQSDAVTRLPAALPGGVALRVADASWGWGSGGCAG